MVRWRTLRLVLYSLGTGIRATTSCFGTAIASFRGCKPNGLAQEIEFHAERANTPDTDLFLDPAKPSYIGGMLQPWNSRLCPYGGSLTTTRNDVHPGRPALFHPPPPFIILVSGAILGALAKALPCKTNTTSFLFMASISLGKKENDAQRSGGGRLSVNRLSQLLLAVIIAVVWPALGCSSGTAKARLLNASPGEAALNGMVNGSSFASNVAFATASNYASVTSGLVTLEIEPSGSTSAQLNETVSLLSNMPYTVMLVGYPPSISTAILTDNNSAPSAGNILLRVVNASPSLGTADVYVVRPNTALDSVSPTVSFLIFASASHYVSLAAGSYEVVFTETGQTVPVISSGSLTFTAGQVRSIVGLNGAVTGYTTAVITDMN